MLLNNPSKTPRIFLFTQQNCLACDVVKMFLEARQLAFEERDIANAQVLAELRDLYHAASAPTLVVLTAAGPEIIEGFYPDRIDRCLAAA